MYARIARYAIITICDTKAAIAAFFVVVVVVLFWIWLFETCPGGLQFTA